MDVDWTSDDLVASIHAAIAAGASLSASCHEFFRTPPLAEASRHGRRDAVACLLAAGAPMDLRARSGSWGGTTPLWWAAGHGVPEVADGLVGELLSAGADPRIGDIGGVVVGGNPTFPAAMAAARGNTAAVTRIIAAMGGRLTTDQAASVMGAVVAEATSGQPIWRARKDDPMPAIAIAVLDACPTIAGVALPAVRGVGPGTTVLHALAGEGTAASSLAACRYVAAGADPTRVSRDDGSACRRAIRTADTLLSHASIAGGRAGDIAAAGMMLQAMATAVDRPIVDIHDGIVHASKDAIAGIAPRMGILLWCVDGRRGPCPPIAASDAGWAIDLATRCMSEPWAMTLLAAASA